MKRALLIGINRYPRLEHCDLSGCVNDADDMEALLRKTYGFEAIEKLTDDGATRAAIIAALENLVASASAGDELVFHYSGHGTRVRDVSGDERDGLDEAICPVDTSMDNDDALIIDDTLRNLFARIPDGAFLSVISDSCHSGSVTRELRERHWHACFLERGAHGMIRRRLFRGEVK